MEYVVLSCDTTESDLKQRREIVSGTAHYMDQAAVKAAMEGKQSILNKLFSLYLNWCKHSTLYEILLFLFIRLFVYYFRL